MKSRQLTALLAALVISGGCTLLLGRKLTHSAHRAAPQKQYLAAAHPIAVGQVIQAADVKTISWPANLPLQGGLATTKDVVGRAAIFPVVAGQPILSTDLAAPGSSLGITTRIPDGMRAIALHTDDVIAVGGFIFPGSHVDVLVTYRNPGNPQPITATVLQNALVLATGHQTQPDPQGKPTTVNIVTLLLSPEDAERAVLASTQGTIHFVLRNGADQQKSAPPPADLAELDGYSPQPRGPVAHYVHRHPAAPKPKPYVVQTILGSKIEDSTF
uniref:Flp pilus assembly protein CpaB n=1 Tax=Acidobacterium capsulatum TaxID=33075 RepID=A0A7V4XQD6_9BACT